MMADDAEMDEEIERQLEAEARNNIYEDRTQKLENEVFLSINFFSYIYIYNSDYCYIFII